jgi:hypothetical protein
VSSYLKSAQERKDDGTDDGTGHSDVERGSDDNKQISLKIQDAIKTYEKGAKIWRRDDLTGPIPFVIYNLDSRILLEQNRGKIDQFWQVSTGDRAMIRKIWEVGIESVLVQTVIQIEGDVTNRLSPRIVAGNRVHLLDVHQRGVETSLKMWGSLIGVAESLIKLLGRS